MQVSTFFTAQFASNKSFYYHQTLILDYPNLEFNPYFRNLNPLKQMQTLIFDKILTPLDKNPYKL